MIHSMSPKPTVFLSSTASVCTRTPLKLTKNRSALWVFLVALSSLILSACSTTQIETLHQQTTAATPINARYYHVKIPSFDGTKIKATIYQPALEAHQTAPVILHAHGFGVWRMRAPTSMYGSLITSGIAAKEAWKRGYWVISYDHRGFGGSEGEVQIMSPDAEVKDVSAIIDWASTQLPRVQHDEGDPVVGMVGESYGGGAQLLASIQDPRIDAIVPITTWHDLGEALAPNGHVKTYWNMVLLSAATVTSGFDNGILFQKPFVKSLTGGTMTPEVKELLAKRSMSYYCEQGLAPHADTLLIQGFRDTAFPVNHAWQNHHCLLEHGKDKTGNPIDVRLMLVQGGHILPTQKLTGAPFYNMEKEVQCEDRTYTMTKTITDWLDYHLQPSRLTSYQDNDTLTLPDLCITQDYDSGIVAKTLHQGGEGFDVPASDVQLGLAGMAEIVLRPINWFTSLFKRDNPDVTLDELETEGGMIRPTFIPLKVADKTGVLFGMPTAELTLAAKKEGHVVFAGIGLKRAKQNNVSLISEQVQPLKGSGRHQVTFPAVSSDLKRGDVLGLVLFGTNSQYALNRPFIPSKAIVSGRLYLPLFRKHVTEYVAYSPLTPTAYPLLNTLEESERFAGIKSTRSPSNNAPSNSPLLINHNNLTGPGSDELPLERAID